MSETKTVRPIAMGVGAIRIADVGDGVPGTDFTTLPLPTKSSVAFNFADPKEVKIDIEGSTEPLYVEFVKDTTDYIEFSIPTPSNDTIALLAGGTVDKGEDLSPKDVWNKPTDIPSINKTFQCETLPKKGKKVVYTVVNGKIAAKISQAPGAEQAELLLVRVYVQAAITEKGETKTAFMREVTDAAPKAKAAKAASK
ncbi:hypothetical protein HMPREF9011_02500 [Bacteroides sp. 3_1_40A]|nr:hypothetical protein HMPREF9011_02500 [Bacteroides sp. 3_1_40A]